MYKVKPKVRIKCLQLHHDFFQSNLQFIKIDDVRKILNKIVSESLTRWTQAGTRVQIVFVDPWHLPKECGPKLKAITKVTL